MPHPGAFRQLELFPDIPVSEDPPAGRFRVSPPPAPAPAKPAKPKPESKDETNPPSAGELSERAARLAASLGLKKLSKKVSVHWNPRMRTTAGRAHYEALRIELNPGLIALPGIDGPAEIDRTLRHELAHLVAHLRSRGRRIHPHGPEWRRACSDLGIPGEERCHTLPFTTRQIRRKYLYRCPVCEVEIPRVRKFRKAVACYDCCRKHNRGRYDDQFRLVAVRQKSR